MAEIKDAVRYLIYVDENGNEINRKPMTKGRPPKGSTVNSEGNRICPPYKRMSPEYRLVEADGSLIRSTVKGRGKPQKGYVKATDGPHKGHWVKVAEETEPTAAPQ